MPYTPAQCRAFGAKESRGESVPSDWHEHCRGKSERKSERRKGGSHTGPERRKGERRRFAKSNHEF